MEGHDDLLSADYVLNSFHILNLFKHDRRHCPTHWLSAAPFGCIYVHAARLGGQCATGSTNSSGKELSLWLNGYN